MNMIAVDVLVVIRFSFKTKASNALYTNARHEALEEILSAWLQDQMGHGGDPSPPNNLDPYIVKIGLALDGDVFATESNTGNKGLTVGIVLDVISRLSTLPKHDLSEWSE